MSRDRGQAAGAREREQGDREGVETCAVAVQGRPVDDAAESDVRRSWEQQGEARDSVREFDEACVVPLRVAMIGTRGFGWLDGGVERAVAALSAALCARGHAVTVYGRAEYTHGGSPLPRGVQEVILPHVRSTHLEAASHSLLAALHVVGRQRPDVVHFHALGPTLFSVLPRLAAVPTVATIHALDWERPKWGPFARRVLQFAGRVASEVPHETIVVSRGLQGYVRGRYGAETTYIPNGVTPEGQTAVPVTELAGQPFLLFLGRLVPEKGVHTLLRAFSLVRTDVRLAIVGSSARADFYLRELHEAAAQDDRVMFLGSRYGGEKRWLLENALGFVQPSTVEGMPIALLEAIIAGARGIVSDIPPHLEIVANAERAGIEVVSFRVGSAEDLAEKLRGALEGPRDSRGATAAFAAEHDWGLVACATEAVYQAAIDDVAQTRWRTKASSEGRR